MADENRTPCGCSFVNGRCFDRLELQNNDTEVYAYFHDGSEYIYHNLDPNEAILWVNLFDAGCYFNMEIWPGNFTKVRGPN